MAKTISIQLDPDVEHLVWVYGVNLFPRWTDPGHGVG